MQVWVCVERKREPESKAEAPLITNLVSYLLTLQHSQITTLSCDIIHPKHTDTEITTYMLTHTNTQQGTYTLHNNSHDITSCTDMRPHLHNTQITHTTITPRGVTLI